jgi:hypothetical protein
MQICCGAVSIEGDCANVGFFSLNNSYCSIYGITII